MDSDGTGDLGIYILGQHITEYGWIFRPLPARDYGIDAIIENYDEMYAAGKLIGVQVKSGPSYFEKKITKDKKHLRFSVKPKHKKYWVDDYSLPVIVVLIDTTTQKGYWQVINPTTLYKTGSSYRVDIPIENEIPSTEPLLELHFPEAYVKRSEEKERLLAIITELNESIKRKTERLAKEKASLKKQEENPSKISDKRKLSNLLTKQTKEQKDYKKQKTKINNAVTAIHKGDYKKAIRITDTITINEFLSDSHSLKSFAHYKLNDLPSAEQHALIATKLKSSYQNLDWQSFVAYELQKYQESLNHSIEARKLLPKGKSSCVERINTSLFLANIYLTLNDYKNCKKELDSVKRIIKTNFGEDSRQMLTALTLYARLYGRQPKKGKYAAQAYAKALTISENDGVGVIDKALLYNSCAKFYIDQVDRNGWTHTSNADAKRILKQAEEYAYYALRLLEKELGEDDVFLTQVLINYASILSNSGKTSGAFLQYERALKLLLSGPGENNYEVANIYNNLAALEMRIGYFNDPDDPDESEIINLERIKKAENYLYRAEAILENILVEGPDQNLIDLYGEIAFVLDILEKHDEAAFYRVKQAKEQKKL